jgi:regulator of sigma E protease
MDTNVSMLAASGLGLAWPILQFIIGLGLMVFVHELGHFLAAKWVGIRVERFALGFGPRVLGVVWGETDYCINLLPLGGYIKMLGQEDFAPQVGLFDGEKVNPRSYNAKSVGARMLVISAGVVMNAITAIIMFVVIAMVGHEFPAPVLGMVKPHFPASRAKITWAEAPGATTQPVVTTGLKVGDRISRIDGNGVMLAILGPEVHRFDRLFIISAMSDRDDRYRFGVEREVDGNTWVGTADVGVKMGDGRLEFGLGPARSTTVSHSETDVIRSPRDPFLEKDRVIAVGGRKIEHSWQVAPAIRDANGLTVPVTVMRDGKAVNLTAPRLFHDKTSVAYLPDGNKLNLDDYNPKPKDANMVLVSYVTGKETTCAKDDLDLVAANGLLDVLGMTPRLAAGAIIKGSPAEKAGMKPGDIVVHYGDTPLPTNKQLHEINDKAVEDGKKDLTLLVQREGKLLAPFRVTPVKKSGTAIVGFAPGLDLAHMVVAHVRPNSPAARAGIEAGCVIEKVNGRPVKDWAELYAALKDLAGKEVTLTVHRSVRPGAELAEAKIGLLDKKAFDPDDYEFSMFINRSDGFLGPVVTTVRKENIGEALTWSLRESTAFMVSTYVSIRSLILGNVSTNQFVGPLGMGGIAVKAAEASFMQFFYFMAIISAVLAVMNFLPLPVVDGGHAVFLIIEKIRGKPLPIKVMNITQLVGLIMLGLVFLALTYQDITQLF